MTYARSFACLAFGLALLMAHSAVAGDLVRVDVPDDYKYACHDNSDCTSIATTCDATVPRCCEYDAMIMKRTNDYNAMKSRACTPIPGAAPPMPGTLTHPGQCTICEPESTHAAECRNNKCVYIGSDMSSSDRRPGKKNPNQVQSAPSLKPISPPSQDQNQNQNQNQ